MAQRMTSRLELLGPKTARRRISASVATRQREALSRLPKGAKISLALDCWTSPFQQAFMAVTGYFIDDNWDYREMLLGFEPLTGTHTGMNLSVVVMDLLKQHRIADQVLAITTDNASNNNTLMESIQDAIQSLNLGEGITVIRVPCLAHVIQLSLKQLLGHMKADPKNDLAQKDWYDPQEQSPRNRPQQAAIIDTLNKVRQPHVTGAQLTKHLQGSALSDLCQRQPAAPRTILRAPD